MAIFALEKWYDEGQICTFYTVRWEDEELSETDKFFVKFRKDEKLKSSLQDLAKFLKIVIGDERGAIDDSFRFENAAQALPPSGRYKVGEVIINYGNFPLRLYCLKISKNLVVLFNGGEKTSQNAQSGKTSMVFLEAGQFAKRILGAIQEGNIFIAPNGRTFREDDGDDDTITIY